MAPAIQVVRQYDQLANATLTAALIQAIFAATIESDAPTEQLLSALQDEEEQAKPVERQIVPSPLCSWNTVPEPAEMAEADWKAGSFNRGSRN